MVDECISIAAVLCACLCGYGCYARETFLAILMVMRQALLAQACNEEMGKAGLSDGNNQGVVG